MKVIRVHKDGSNRKDWGCPMTKNRSPWCYGMCAPNEGLGQCGRVAPHALYGRTRLAILRYNASHQTA